MSVKKELDILASYCKGVGINIGCGNAQIAESIGVDISPAAQAAVVLADACFLPFKDDTFDYVVSSACLEHLEAAPILALREWLRVIKPGGTIAVVVPDAKYGIWSMTGDTGKCGQFTKKQREMEHLHAFTVETLNVLFKFAGMEVIRCEVIERKPVRFETTIVCVGIKSSYKK